MKLKRALQYRLMYDPREGPSAESQKFTSSMLSKRGANRNRDESSVLTSTSREGGGTRQMMGSSIETREGGAVQESSSEDEEDNIERESMKDSRKE